ncbi:MAG: MBL fold metallo-hydrolase, partial [Gemmatimonadota bacterium]
MTPRWPLPGAIESTDRRVRLGAWLICALFCTGVPNHAIAQDDPVRVVFLDVGQGDAALILAPEGQAALIDAGPGVDLTPALRRWGVDSLVLAVASHPHADHLGGMRQVLRSVPVRNYMDNGQPYTTATYQAVMVELRNRPEIVYLQAVPRRLQLGSVTITVLPPPTDSESNLNDNSVGLVIEYGGFSAFFSGDSERPELDHFLQVGAVPDVTLLKAPPHGSDDAVLESFLQTARPEIVVIPVGYGNDYGHPNPAALRTYGRFAEELLRTDVHGDVVVAGYRD